jgi:hypothetical protein
MRIAGAIAHGTLDFAISNIHALEQGAMYFGCEGTGFTAAQKGGMFLDLSQRQDDRVNALGGFLMDAQGINHYDPFYNNIRYGTALGLEIGTLAT